MAIIVSRWKDLCVVLLLLALCGLTPGNGMAAPDAPAYQLALSQYDSGNYRGAATTLSATLEKHPESASTELLLARCYYELKQWDQAVFHAKSAVRISPSDSEAHLWLARSYGRKAGASHSLKLAVETRKEFEKAVTLSPDNVEARNDLMEYYLDAPWVLGGSKSKASKQAQAIAALDPIEGYLAWGQVDLHTGQLAQARQQYQRVLASKVDRVGPYLDAASFFLAQGDQTQFMQAVQAAFRANAADMRLKYFRGIELILQGKAFPEAERDLKSYLADAPSRNDFPSHAAAMSWLGELYARWGKKELATRQYEAALAIDPSIAQARQGLARLHSQ
ncbi:MAG: tetratricopeptide repeat protein [Terriglobia bacterium]